MVSSHDVRKVSFNKVQNLNKNPRRCQRLASLFSCFPDGTRYQGFPPGGYKCLLFFIIGCLINKSGIDGAWALVVDGFSIEGLEHGVAGVQWFPVTVLKQ